MHLKWHNVLIVAILLALTETTFQSPTNLIVILEDPHNVFRYNNIDRNDKPSDVFTFGKPLRKERPKTNNIKEHELIIVQKDHSFEIHFGQTTNLKHRNVGKVTKMFLEKTDRNHLVHPSRYYRVSNSFVHGITPYASFFPVNSNGEVNHLFIKQPSNKVVY